MKFKPLEWISGRNDYSMDGKLQRARAEVELKLKNGDYKIYKTYNISRGAIPETQERWFLLILDDGNVKLQEEVESLEFGKMFSEHEYQKYMNEYYEGLQKFLV